MASFLMRPNWEQGPPGTAPKLFILLLGSTANLSVVATQAWAHFIYDLLFKVITSLQLLGQHGVFPKVKTSRYVQAYIHVCVSMSKSEAGLACPSIGTVHLVFRLLPLLFTRELQWLASEAKPKKSSLPSAVVAVITPGFLTWLLGMELRSSCL